MKDSTTLQFIFGFTLRREHTTSTESSYKKIYPLLWDVSVAGHVNSGESLLTAAIREVKEEIGITVGENDLIKIGVMKSFQSYKSGIIDNEFHTIFISKLNDDIENLSPQKEEVEALKTVSISLFKKLLENSENNSHFVTSNKEYYVFVLKKINDFIKKNKP